MKSMRQLSSTVPSSFYKWIFTFENTSRAIQLNENMFRTATIVGELILYKKKKKKSVSNFAAFIYDSHNSYRTNFVSTLDCFSLNFTPKLHGNTNTLDKWRYLPAIPDVPVLPKTPIVIGLIRTKNGQP